MQHVGTKKLETERLVLRRLRVSDARAMFENWASDPEVANHLSWKAHSDVAFTRSLLAQWVTAYESADNYNWGIVLKATNTLIGSISVVAIRPHCSCASVGYCLSKKYWNEGIMTEAFCAVITYLFDEADFNRVEAVHALDNPASGKVMLKSGLLHEGITRAGTIDNAGRFIDIARYGILKSDPRKRRVDIKISESE